MSKYTVNILTKIVNRDARSRSKNYLLKYIFKRLYVNPTVIEIIQTSILIEMKCVK